MDATELETALEELELRLERLRALYEQYFLGIEKVPPVVVRADVDRRMWALRKEQIHNTAKRFKLQTIVQRYNTFQQYWQRICREIENGTYSPHIARARKQLDPSGALTIMARRRLGTYSAEARKAAAERSEATVREAEQQMKAALADLDSHGNGAPTPPPKPAARRVESSDLARPPPPPNQRPSPSPPTQSLLPRLSHPAAPPAPGLVAAPPKVTIRDVPGPAPPLAGAASAARAAEPLQARAPAPSATAGAVGEQRFEQLHRQLVEAKRHTKEANTLSLTDLQRRLEATERQLRGQYRDRTIEFAVVIKDGRAMIKPIVR